MIAAGESPWTPLDAAVIDALTAARIAGLTLLHPTEGAYRYTLMCPRCPQATFLMSLVVPNPAATIEQIKTFTADHSH